MFFALAALLASPLSASMQPGLTVKDGTLLKDGTPCRGIGVNYFSLFYRTLKNPGDKSYDDELQQLSEAGITFARFMCCGFWPKDWKLYLIDKGAYFRQLDAVIKCGVGGHQSR